MLRCYLEYSFEFHCILNIAQVLQYLERDLCGKTREKMARPKRSHASGVWAERRNPQLDFEIHEWTSLGNQLLIWKYVIVDVYIYIYWCNYIHHLIYDIYYLSCVWLSRKFHLRLQITQCKSRNSIGSCRVHGEVPPRPLCRLHTLLISLMSSGWDACDHLIQFKWGNRLFMSSIVRQLPCRLIQAAAANMKISSCELQTSMSKRHSCVYSLTWKQHHDWAQPFMTYSPRHNPVHLCQP